MVQIQLEKIPGLGEKSIAKIVAGVGIENIDSFVLELAQCSFRRLFSLDLDGRIVSEIVKYCYSLKYQFPYADKVIQSSVISKLQQELFSLIKKQFVLETNSKRIVSFSPTDNVEEISRRQAIVRRAVHFFTRFEARKVSEIRSLLKVPKQKVRFDHEIMILCDEQPIFENLRELVPKEIVLIKINSLAELEEYANEEFIRYIYSEDSKFVSDVEMAENVEAIKWNGPSSAVPELLFHRFRSEQVFLEAALVLIEDYGIEINTFDRETLLGVTESLESEERSGQEISRKDLDEFCKVAENLVEEKLSNMQISGRELLSLLKSDVKDHALLSSIVADVKKELSEMEGSLGKEKVRYLDFSSALPCLDEEKLLDLAREQAMNVKRRKYLLAKDFASRFLEKEWIIEACKQFLEEVDFRLGMGETFADAQVPKIVQDKSNRFSCLELKSSIMLSKGVDVQPISYYLDRAQTIVTGANSGGKTSLLHLIAETQLLAMMGLFVRGEVELSLYEEIHFFKKSNGTVGSGAFETTLKSFASIATSSADALILIDEIESITEPGAAGRLIAGTLEWLSHYANKDVVLVSHLGDVLSELCPQARIDGIEAKALSDSLELIVDRNPKIGVIAKSTPQLIVEKLARIENSSSKAQSQENGRYFEFLLAKMSG